MMPPVPYAANVRSISYRWEREDHWRSAHQKLKAQDAISGLRNRFLLALAVGMSEFVFRRHDPANARDLVFGNLVEAFWAAVIDRRYLKLVAKEHRFNAVKQRLITEGTPLDSDLWQYAELCHPTTGPQWVAVSHLVDAVDCTTRTNGAELQTVYVSNLVSQILGQPKSGPFVSWRRAVMKRLKGKDAKAPHSYYWLEEKDFNVPPAERDLLGPIIPPQVVDPAAPFSPDVSSAWAKSFLEGLIPHTNPFLTPADELVSLGMTHPYRLVP